MKRVIILILLLMYSNTLLAQSTCILSTGAYSAPDCDSTGALVVAPSTSSAATFAALDATTDIGAAYASAVDLPAATKIVILDNQTNGDVMVSMDGGTSDTYHIKAGDVLSLNLAAAGLVTTADVQIKDGTTASSSGTFYVYSIK